jgi:hypothetical protein
MKAPVSTAIAIGVGLVVLLGYFISLPLLTNLREILVGWAVILAAVALFVGVANLLMVHGRRVTRSTSGSSYSLVLIISLIATLIVSGLFGSTGYWSLWIIRNIQIPVETSLIALLTVVLIYAAARLLRRKLNLFSVVFLFSALLVLLGTAPLFGIEAPFLYGENGLRSLLSQGPAVAGARGILLGVALGAVATGLRILMGVDRPYGG